MTMLDLRHRPDTAPAEIVDTVNRYGGCVIENFLDAADVARLREEIESVMSGSPAGVSIHLQAPHATAKSALIENMSADEFPVIHDVVKGKGMREITVQYFSGEDISFPAKLFFVRSLGRDGEEINQLPYLPHFDRHQFLKFFIYLTDVDEDCGPTVIVPEGPARHRAERLGILKQKMPQPGDNVIQLGAMQEVPLTGPAGSMVIFDTDVPHRAGQLAAGRERLVLRVDTESLSNKQLYEAATKKKSFAARLKSAFS